MKTKRISSKQLMALVLILIGAVSSVFGVIGLTGSSSKDPYESRNGIVMVYATVYDNEGNSEAGMGTGWAIGTPGQPVEYIVTNGHVVNKAYTYPRYDSSLYGGEIDVFFSAAENDYVKAKVVYYSPQEEKDIAILQLPSPTDKRTALTLRDSGDIKIGDTAYALGYPGNSSQRQDFATYDVDDITITRGIISKRTTTSFSTYEAFQMDVSIAPGNSGGPLVDEKGNVIGINVAGAIDPNTGLSLGMNYAIIINELTKVLDVERIPYTMAGSGFSLLHGPGSAVLLVPGILLIVAGAFFFWKERNAATGNISSDPAHSSPAGVANSRGGVAGQRNNGSFATGTTDGGLANGAANNIGTTPANGTANGSAARAVLRGMTGKYAGQSFDLLKGKVTIGRDPSFCNIVYDKNTPGISSRHCQLSYNPAEGCFLLTDLGSSYGTYLANGKKLTPNIPEKLYAGDSFFLCDPANQFQAAKE